MFTIYIITIPLYQEAQITKNLMGKLFRSDIERLLLHDTVLLLDNCDFLVSLTFHRMKNASDGGKNDRLIVDTCVGFRKTAKFYFSYDQ